MGRRFKEASRGSHRMGLLGITLLLAAAPLTAEAKEIRDAASTQAVLKAGEPQPEAFTDSVSERERAMIAARMQKLSRSLKQMPAPPVMGKTLMLPGLPDPGSRNSEGGVGAANEDEEEMSSDDWNDWFGGES